MRKPIALAVLLLAGTIAFGQEKVSGGNTPPSGGPTVQDKAAAEKERREAAKKALDALKGKQDKEKDGGRKGR